jgi:uncharacterized membrane-anchored protein YhcB (DUF1043 family)
VSAFAIILVSGIAGAFAGAVLTRRIDPQRKAKLDQEAQIRKAQEELAHYRQQMNDHFVQTSHLLQAITEDCRRLQDHVAIDALKLTGLDLREATSRIEESNLHLAQLTAGQSIEAPRDYAPRTKGAVGMLSEEYGLHDDYDEEPKPVRG